MCLLEDKMESLEEVITLSESSSPSMSTPDPQEICHICGDKANNKRYGAPACLGCTVFFRRTIVKNLTYRCLKEQKCVISFSYRCACRACRFAKCLKVGLRGSAIQRRDLVGPRKMSRDNSGSPEVIFMDDNFFGSWVRFQQQQHLEHLPYFAAHDVDVAFHIDSQNVVKYRRRARAHDVQVMLKLSLKQAGDWANRLKPFKKLPEEFKKSILAEYFFAFLLVDQAYKTAREADLDIWLLQNGSFMHKDYFFGLPLAAIDMESMKVKTQIHFNFVSELLNTIINPFRKLQIDDVECAALKIILLLRPSCSQRAVYSGQEGVLAGLYTACMDELMEHCLMKFPENGAERFGEIILLISSIRCGVKVLYNQTRVSDMFNFMNFDDSVKNVLLW